MARELVVSTTSGNDIYAIGRVLNGTNIGLWGNIDDGTLDTYVAADFAKYDIVMTELGDSGFYEADMPDVFDGERAIDIIFYTRAGGAPVEGDTKISGSTYELMDDWVATAVLAV